MMDITEKVKTLFSSPYTLGEYFDRQAVMGSLDSVSLSAQEYSETSEIIFLFRDIGFIEASIIVREFNMNNVLLFGFVKNNLTYVEMSGYVEQKALDELFTANL